MGHDPFSPVSLAQVDVLCVPAGRITVHKFEEYLRAFRSFGDSSFSRYKDGQVVFRFGKEVGWQESVPKKIDATDINAGPQVIIGLTDGEASATDPHEYATEHLLSTEQDFQQAVVALNKDAYSCLVVLGGSHISVGEHSYFVDLEGDGPSLLDVVQEIIVHFQKRLEQRARTLRGTVADGVAIGGEVRSLATSNTNRAAQNGGEQVEEVKSSRSKTDANSSSNTDVSGTSARVAVFLGQLNLQAGQWPEALRLFSEGAVTARNDASHLLYAKGLEGLLVCMLLYAWADLDFNIPQICYQTGDKRGPVYNSPSMSAICAANRSTSESLSAGRSVSSAHTLTLLVPQLLNTIISLYERVAGIFQDNVAFNLLCQARVRWGNLLLIMRNHGSVLQNAALQYLVEEADTELSGRPRGSPAVALILHVKSLTKLFTDAALEAHVKLSVKQAAQVQIAIASSLSRLGVERKQAFHLRGFLQRLGPALVEARRIGAAEAGMHPSAAPPPLDAARSNTSGVSRSGVQALLDSLCESYGLPRPQHSQSRSDISARDQLRESLHLWSAAHQAGDVMMKIDILNVCIEVSDSIPDLHSSLNLVARLLQISAGRPTLLANTFNPAPLISSNDQSRVVGNMHKAVGAAIKFGIADVRAHYWDKCLVRLIQLSEELSSNRLMPHTAQDLSLASTAKADTKKDPFIFNPFAKVRGGAGQPVIVVGEQARFDVILQNPLQIDVEIEDITITTEGCEFQPDHHSIVLGPLCSQVFTLTGTAQRTGDLLITGCKATVRDCYPEEFLIVEGDWKIVRTIKSMAGSTGSEPLQTITLPEINSLPLKVTAPLPKFSISSTSLVQQSIMLLEGERISFTVTLQNDSDLDVDFVHVTFEDSVTRRLEEALSNKDLLPADLYEIQNQIASRPVIRTTNNEDDRESMTVSAYQSITVTLEVFGRPGLTDVTIIIDYANLGKPIEDVEGSFYTRQLRHTIMTTINGSIDIPRCSVLPLESNLFSDHSKKDSAMEEKLLLSTLHEDEDATTQCLLLLDVRNIWPHPLEVEFQATRASAKSAHEDQRWQAAAAVSNALQPGQMTRLLLVVPRILLTNPYTPIPSLDTKRQFVVSASKMSIEAEAASRESFWYRERLLDCLKATWKEEHGTRSGQIDMRKGIRLSSRMIDALRIDLVEISFSLRMTAPSTKNNSDDSSSVTHVGDSHFSLIRNNFACLVTKVHNRSTEVLRLLLRLQPSLRNQPHNIALDLSKKFAWSGNLQRALHPPLEPGETRVAELGIIALAEGEYEFNGTAEEIKSRSVWTDSTALDLGNGSERRIWHARRPCLIDAADRTP